MMFRRFRRRQDDELREELDAHLAMAERDRVERGEAPDDARAAARREFGNVALVAEVTREMWAWRALDRLTRDVRFGLRLFRRTPGTSAVTVLTLALGICGVATVFTLVNAVLLKPLPVRAPESLVWLRESGFSYPIFREVRDRSPIFDGVFAWTLRDFTVRWTDRPEQTATLLVTGEFFSTLGVSPALGSPLSTADGGDDPASARPVAMISDDVWRRRFGRDPSVLGRSVRIDDVVVSIVGVTPPGFFGVAVGSAPEIIIPVALSAALHPDDSDALKVSTNAWLHIMGRLRPGLTRAAADAAFQKIWPGVLEATAPPNQPEARRQRYLAQKASLEPGATGESALRQQFRDPLRLLFGLVGLLLLVSCATVANLLLARGQGRAREFSVRLAIGAGRTRLIAQLVIEGVVLAAAGAAIALPLALWLSRVIVGLLSTSSAPVVLATSLDWTVFAFATGVSGLMALAFSLAPALTAAGAKPVTTLNESAADVGGSRRARRTSRALVVAQIGFCTLLLVGAALFLRSLAVLRSVDAGFQLADLFVVHVDPPRGADATRRAAFYRTLQDTLLATPGVTAASLSWVPPISDRLGSWTQSIGIDGALPEEAPATYTFFNAVSPRFFETIGTPFVKGRDFRATDDGTSGRVVIINESLALGVFPGQEPVGRRITIGRNARRRDLEIVGVVRDVKYQRLQEPARRVAYMPYEQLPEFVAGNNLVAEVRVSAPARAQAPDALRRTAQSLAPDSPVSVETAATRLRDSMLSERLLALLAGCLGVVALALSGGALYGLMAYTVGRQRREMALRLALGAAPRSLVWLVVREAMRLAAFGAALGLGAAVIASSAATKLLFGITPLDAPAYLLAALALAVTTMVAGLLPAILAARVEPMTALKSE